MLFVVAGVLVGSLIRIAAPHVRNMVAGRELSRAGMTYMQAGMKPTPIDGVWSPDELPAVAAALQGTGDKGILEIGRERAAAAVRAGCPVCKNCGKLFPNTVPKNCDRCGHDMHLEG